MTPPPATAPSPSPEPGRTTDLVGRVGRRTRRALPVALAAALGSAVLPSATGAAAADDGGSDATTSVPRGESSSTPARQVALAAPVRVLTAAAGPHYRVRSGDTVSGIAARSGVSQQAIIAANHLRADGFLREGQVLVLPTGGASTRRAGAAPVPASGGTYTVRRGDTVSAIAARTGVSQRAIIATNSLDANGFIREGQVLRLPGRGAAVVAPAPAQQARAYTVRRGDTVSAIAARTGVSQRAIIATNSLDANGFIREGQVLRLGGGSAPVPSAPKAAPTRSAGTYTVRPGDSLSVIAARTGTSVQALRQANPRLTADHLLQIGQELALPGGTTAAPVASGPSTFLGVRYPSATVSAADLNRHALASRSVPSRSQMRDIVARTARQYGVDPALAQAIAFQESGFDMRAVSPANAIGVMQVIPSSGEWTSQLVGRRLDLLDPEDNVTAGVALLRELQRGAPDVATAIAGYYQGAASVRSRGMYADTRRYVANVQTLMRQYR